MVPFPPDTGSRFSWRQSGRRGVVAGNIDGTGLTSGYVISHVSNNHLIPATGGIRRAIATVKPGDAVRIEGRLVDVSMVTGNGILSFFTSKTRTDQDDGACEIIYVEHIRINNRSY